MAEIANEIAEIELAARGEEVRDSIVNALNKINGDLNYIESLYVIVDDAVQNSTLYRNGWTYHAECSEERESAEALQGRLGEQALS